MLLPEDCCDLSVHDENAAAFGQLPNGRVDKAKVAAVFDSVVEALSELGFSDIMSSPNKATSMCLRQRNVTNIRFV